MNERELRKKLNQPYSQDNWKEVVNFVFPNVTELSSHQDLPVEAKHQDKIESFRQLGSVRLTDGKNLALFELKLKENVNIIRNRVALNDIVSSYIDQEQIHGVLSVFEQGQEDYRFTFSARSSEYDEEAGDFIARKTDTKRYTYVLGKNESCRTAAERFYKLSEKKDEADIKAIEHAFSVETLSKNFFKEYKQQYELFVDYLTQTPSYYTAVFSNDDKAIRDWVKLLLGRLVFIKFVQKKGWLGVPADESGWQNGNYRFLEEQFENFEHKNNFYSQFLNPLFFEGFDQPNRPNEVFELTGTKIPFLSGGLFDNNDPKTRTINFPKDYFEGLFEFLEKYNFTIDENDTAMDREVGIDPEMLGHIFENLLEDNKDKGAFYTPKEIVRYMCQESLKEYLKTYLQKQNQWPNDELKQKELEDALHDFITKKEAGHIIDFDDTLSQALKDVKICDPAIGSGAFPMGLLNEIFQLVHKLFDASPDKVGNIWKMDTWQPDVVKLNIIQQSIYGVDIEKGAVEIARLRFWLSLVVDSDEPQALPHLDYKIVVGDSLVSKFNHTIIDIDWDKKGSVGDGQEYIEDLNKYLKLISKKQKNFFNEEDSKRQERLKSDIRNIKLEVLINQLSYNKAVYINNNNKVEDMGFGLKAKDHKKNLEIDMHLADFNNTIKDLRALKENPEKKFSHFDWKLDFPEIMNPEVATETGFDIVIGNPPYVSNKGVEADLKEFYGFSDDLYNYFFIKGNDILTDKGVFCYITSSTFLTLQSKANIRDLILKYKLVDLVNLGHDVFDSAMVSTAITIYNKTPYNDSFNCNIIDARGKSKLAQAKQFKINVSEFKRTPNNVLFTPNEFNNEIHETYSAKLESLLSNYWEMISTSRNISKYANELNIYRESLNPGDITLLGLITDGGQGLATANNGRFVGVIKGTKEARRVFEARKEKIKAFNKKNDTSFDIENKTEKEIRTLFDNLKKEYDRDCFGQGFLFRIVDESELADVEELTKFEKEKGISNKKCFVPYDKGDKDGNRWFLKTPYVIEWSIDNVKFLRENSGKKGKGMPVLRNPDFYFKEGYCWSDIHTVLIKSRLKGKSVYDVKSMSLFPMSELMTAKYLVCIINSKFASQFSHEFLNNTSSFQINDARRLPIIVPTDKQLEEFEEIFDKSYQIQLEKFDNKISEDVAEKKLEIIQKELDYIVNELYNLN